jgi:hypothetical protein
MIKVALCMLMGNYRTNVVYLSLGLKVPSAGCSNLCVLQKVVKILDRICRRFAYTV